MRTSLEHWQGLWDRLDLPEGGEAWHKRLVVAYAEPQRSYHTLQHLEECLAEFDAAKATGKIAEPDLLEMALWFHDAAYDPQGDKNEELSAQMAEEALAGSSHAPMIRRLIMLTKRHQPEDGADDAWMIDIDLAIFGQSAERVLEYDQQIRAEYAWALEAVYREKRLEILTSFLKRDRLYLTDWFQARQAQKARENLALLIEKL